MSKASVLHSALVLDALLGTSHASAACLPVESESNNSEQKANSGLCSGVGVSGTVASARDADWLRIDVASAGAINISLAHDGGIDLEWYLSRPGGVAVTYRSTLDNPEAGSFNAPAAGTYYIRVKCHNGLDRYTLDGRGLDVDEALKWMIGKSGGGDFVVLRSSGTDAYNDYIYAMGGANSVQTLLVTSTTQANDACVVQTIRNAGAVFLAGGDQADYANYFKGQGVGNALNYLINTKRAPVGGTSAGMAIQGQYYHPGGADQSGDRAALTARRYSRCQGPRQE